MRGLIRVTIVDPGGGLPPRYDREKYDKEVIELFRAVGYDPRSPGEKNNLPTQIELQESAEVRNLFENLGGTILEEERKHLVMLGYTNAGQAWSQPIRPQPFSGTLFDAPCGRCLSITKKKRFLRSSR